jgi:nucleotide-binding universal stress UspA family protein
MSGPTAVIVGLDGSDTSWDAFWWACGETKRLAGRAVAVLVSPAADSALVAASASFAAASAYGSIAQVTSELAEELRQKACRYALDHGIDLTFVHARGDPAHELLRVAEAEHADLIVVGSSTKARHHVAGSLGRRLIGRRRAPIIVVVP